jgi:predicted alpha-1,2-mannosidase
LAGPWRRSTCLIAFALTAIVVAIAAPAADASGGDVARYVNPFVGTRFAARDFNPGATFPGASEPFGMLQWSPDTVRRGPRPKSIGPSRPGPRSGYDYGSHTVGGFSLTHLSGAGCPAYGDIPFLPTSAAVDGSPAAPGSAAIRRRFEATLDHRRELASPGFYRARLSSPGGSAIGAELTATTRTGFGRFTYPRGGPATMLINAGGSAANDSDAEIRIDPAAREVTGSATSGRFCSQRNHYRIYFAAQFESGFRSFGTWTRQRLDPGSTSASDSASGGLGTAAQTGAYVTAAAGTRRLGVRVGISFVSVAGAERNLATEEGARAFGDVRRDARARWDRALGSIRVGGGTLRERRTFYTALYHALLAPRTFSDVDGSYPGMDGRVHVASGYTQYADFSGWDVYRSEIPLLAMIAPDRAADIVDSLLADATESGCLPRWPLANGQTMVMVGDPSDPMIASAAAFGADHFDHARALAAMLDGATAPCRSANGSYVERQGLAPYLADGYIPLGLNVQRGNANAASGSPDAVWGTAATTLEYASADFSIAQFAARFAADRADYESLMRRSANWRRLVNPATGYAEPRLASGAFPRGYAPTSNEGFVEGDSAQYTWAVPFDPAGLAARLGGRVRAVVRLRRFLSILNDVEGGFHSQHALLGNEPSLGAPWLFDWLGRPALTQGTVRRALGLFGPGPADLPGNDDLGELSSWYVLGALGVYPAVPGVGMLAVGSPLFPRATVALAGGDLAIDAPRAAAARPYVHSLRLDGDRYGRPWISFCSIVSGGTLRFGLTRGPDRRWGSTVADRPPSFSPRAPMPMDACAIR